ncbi:MAG: valine--tRNA ligase, partial [Anaerolineae bacterium]
MEFGTGALKITPGHDPNDYEIAQRHGLPIISILDEAARINANGGPYQGLDRFVCREKLWADMQAAGLTLKAEPYRTSIPRSQRGGEIVEPMLSEQWFVRIEPLAKAALEAVRDGRIRIVPERFEKIYFNWLENIKDWCISRQLWWGHRIPVWYCPEGHMTVAREDPTECATCGSPDLKQDPDVLDTWFSSGLWPFSTLGWPEETPDYRYFYPTSYMETGYDILFFWVARMIMMGLEFTGQPPFHTVYLHGLVRDEHGQKMSKTKGNVIDPLIVMDEFGTDALRFTLLVGSTPGNDMNLSVKKVEANRNFANKIWNVGRFVIASLAALGDDGPQAADSDQPSTANWTLADSWIWARLQATIRDVERLFQTFQYGQAGQLIYDFFWSEFADWYVEIAKGQLAQGGPRAVLTAQTLVQVFDMILRMLHPFTPFVTEEVWGHLRQAVKENRQLSSLATDWPEALIIARWPQPRQPEGWEEEKIANFTLIQEIIRAIRNLRAEKNIPLAKKLPATVLGGTKTDLLRQQAPVIASLAGLEAGQLTIQESLAEKPQNAAILVVGPVEIYLPLAGMVDESAERARLQKELSEAEAQIARLEKLLASDFAHKAPPAIVQKEREKLQGFVETAEKIREKLR